MIRLNVWGTWLSALAFVLALSVMPVSAQTAAGRVPITPANVADLTLGYALPTCRFNPDWTLIGDARGVIDVQTGKRRFVTFFSEGGGWFSPDGKWLQVGGLASAEPGGTVYDVATGEISFDRTGVFSPDGRLFAVGSDAVYEAGTWRRLYDYGIGGVFSPDGRWLAGDWLLDAAAGWQHFPITGSPAVFSPDSALLALFDGVHEVPSGALRFETHGTGGVSFSPSGAPLAVDNDGVYDVTTGERRFVIRYSGVFSPDGKLLAIAGDGVYDTATGERRFALQGDFAANSAVFSPDGALLVVEDDGVYDVATGEHLFVPVRGRPQFSPDGTLLAVADDPRGLLPGGEASGGCFIYGAAENPWPVLGLIKPNGDAGVNIRRGPDRAVIESAKSKLIVFAQTADGGWYKVESGEGYGWVSAYAVQPVFIPERLPVENP